MGSEMCIRDRDGLAWVARNIWPVGLVIILTDFVFMAGLVLLIIPGIILSFYLSFTNFVFIREGRGGMTALLGGTDLVRGKWWATLWRFLAVSFLIFLPIVTIVLFLFLVLSLTGLPGFLIGPIVFRVGLSFMAVWFISASTLLYESLAERKPPESFKPDSYKNLRVIYLVLAIVAIPFIVVFSAIDFVTGDDESAEIEPFTPRKVIEDGLDVVSVSYTHLTLPTKRIV